MVSLNDFKQALLIEKNDREHDELLGHILKRAKQFIEMYIYPSEYIDALDSITESIAVKKYNRLHDEGILSKSIGVSVTYSQSLLTWEEKTLLDKFKRENVTNLFFMDTGVRKDDKNRNKSE